MSTIWIVVANSSFAKIYEAKGIGRQIKELQHLDFPKGRIKGVDINTDRPGRAFDSVGTGRHAHSPAVNVHEHENKVFSKEIATILQTANANHSFEKLAIIAPPHFLGELKHAISSEVKKVIFKEVDKDLPEYLSEKERLDLLCGYLDLWNRAPSSSS